MSFILGCRDVIRLLQAGGSISLIYPHPPPVIRQYIVTLSYFLSLPSPIDQVEGSDLCQTIVHTENNCTENRSTLD